MSKIRIEDLLVKRGYYPSIEEAKKMVMLGYIFDQNGQRIDNGHRVANDLILQVKDRSQPFVSRGGFKLKKAIDTFQIDFNDKIVMDIGSSTGGFSDCALQYGAQHIYAIDSGTNQLDWKLRSNPKVIVYEKTNFRFFTQNQLIIGNPNIITIDVSFISTRLIFKNLIQFLNENTIIIVLIKPQFEATKEQITEKGVIIDPDLQIQIIQSLFDDLASLNIHCQQLTYSPIKGASGNIEFLAQMNYLTPNHEFISVKTTVEEAHLQLD